MAENSLLNVSQANSNITEYFGDPREWSYRCEGAWTMVVSLIKTKTVLRLRKEERSKKSPTSKEQDYLRETLNNLDFAKHVMSPLLGGDYVHVGKTISVPRGFASAMNEISREHRPDHRLGKEIDENCSFGVVMPDFCFVPLASRAESNSGVATERINPTLSVEIKPKCGFIPNSPYIDPSRAIKYSVCHYCMLQKSKVKEGKYKRQSKYCPLDLFSRDPQRVMYSLECLVSDPQNNVRVFCDGKGIFTEELVQETIQAGKVCCAEKYFEVTLKEIGFFSDCGMPGCNCEDGVTVQSCECGDGVTNRDSHLCADDVTTESHQCGSGVTTACHKPGDGVIMKVHEREGGEHNVNAEGHVCGDALNKEAPNRDKLFTKESLRSGDGVIDEGDTCGSGVTKDSPKFGDDVTSEVHKCGQVGPYTKKFLGILLEILISDSKKRKLAPIPGSLLSSTQMCKESKYPESNFNIQSNLKHLQFGMGGVLQQVLSIQKLDDLDVEGIYKLYQEVVSHFQSNPGVRDSLGVDGPYTLPLWKSVASSLGHSNSEISHNTVDTTSKGSNSAISVFNLNLHDKNILRDAVLKICKFAVSNTARDCSVMIAFQKTSTKDDKVPMAETADGNVFCYKINLVDLDPKEFDRVVKYFKDSKNAVENYLE